MDEEITDLFNNEDLSDQEVAERMGLWDSDSDNLSQMEEEEEKETKECRIKMLRDYLDEIKQREKNNHCRKFRYNRKKEKKTVATKRHVFRKSIIGG